MASSTPHIPRKRPNPAMLERALDQKERGIAHLQGTVMNLSGMVQQNCRMLGQLIGMVEVLKDKGMITNEEINNKLKELDDKRQEQAKEALEAERKIIADKSLGRDTEGGDTAPKGIILNGDFLPKEKSDLLPKEDTDTVSDSPDPEGCTVQSEDSRPDESSE